MRNFVPLSLFAAAASLAALDSPVLHFDQLASAPHESPFRPAMSDQDERPALLPARPATLQFTTPACAHGACEIRRPMI
jgi:hypothetical protein